MKITNKTHQYYNEEVKVISYHQDGSEKVDLFILSTEQFIEANLSDIAKEEDSLVPKSRKEFYEYVQKATTSRTHIICTLKNLIQQKKILLKTVSEDQLISMANNIEIDKLEFLDEFRSMRDKNCFDFLLPNAIYSSSNRDNQYSHKKRPYKKISRS